MLANFYRKLVIRYVGGIARHNDLNKHDETDYIFYS
jgi:hypothetical protein